MKKYILPLILILLLTFTLIGDGTAWDVSTASYASKSADISNEDSNPGGLFFKPDGLKMYVTGKTNDRVFQYTLSSAWDVSTASYDNKSADVSNEDGEPRGLFFKPDGLSMYITGYINDRVFQYTLSSAWDVSSASYASKSADVSEDSFPYGPFFKPNGLSMYVQGAGNDAVYQYTLSGAWDLATSSYASKSADISNEDAGSYNVFFEPDGEIMYVVGESNDKVFQYTLGTAWDVSTASYASKSADISNETDNPISVFFKPDGLKMYVMEYTGATIYQYTLEEENAIFFGANF